MEVEASSSSKLKHGDRNSPPPGATVHLVRHRNHSSSTKQHISSFPNAAPLPAPSLIDVILEQTPGKSAGTFSPLMSSPEMSSYSTPSSTPHLIGLTVSPATRAARASSTSSTASSSSVAQPGTTPDLIVRHRRCKGPHTTPQSSGFTSPETRSPAYVASGSPHSTPRWEPLDTSLPDVTEGGTSADDVMLSDAADPKDLRQALLRRNVAALRRGRETTSGSELEEVDEDEPPLVGEEGEDSNTADPFLVKMLFVVLYPLFLLFFLIVGEVLPSAKEALLRASRVFLLTAKAPPDQDRREKA